MGVASESGAERPPQEPVKLRRLLPAGAPAAALQIADELEATAARHPPPTRPYVIVNMISTADGRASIGGRSGPLGGGAQLEYVRAERHGTLDLKRALAEVRERFEVRSLLCEGGPHLNAHLLAAGLVDELFLTLSPKLAGGDPMSGESLRIIAGPDLDAPVELDLRGVLEHDSQLFLRYGVRA